ncbi:Rz1-like lysis system protein LysC [Aeromonas popoffii]|uniref:Rz1-like lysis system protein LysC n=1 Tax=Aeromonas popoffii TaxID=70856 RepID=UPI003BB07437
MILSGCNATPSIVAPCPTDIVPRHLLAPCLAPAFTVTAWGDYPDYVARLHLALEKCNTDKVAIEALLLPTTNPNGRALAPSPLKTQKETVYAQ